MTIALGFTCQEGIVLGADTQLTATGSHKGYACKLFSHGSIQGSWLAATTYAGYPAVFDSFNDRFREEMHHWEKQVAISVPIVRDLIESVLKHLGPANKSTIVVPRFQTRQ
jgi:20S proteasome alpha/beta subunit